MTTEEQILELIAEQALMDAEDIKMNDTLEDLGLDSLGFVEIVYGIEEAFDIQVPFNANEPEDNEFDISTIQAVVDGVKDLISEKETG
ncbi:MAG: phosphopantetheine-binding protein [Pseudomonadota bacterium]